MHALTFFKKPELFIFMTKNVMGWVSRVTSTSYNLIGVG